MCVWRSQADLHPPSTKHKWSCCPAGGAPRCSVGWAGRRSLVCCHDPYSVSSAIHPTPNHLESMPIKMFEYMAAGIPAVVSNFDHFRSLGGANALYVDPCDPQDIARAINWILDHPDEAQEMGQRGRLSVEEELNWEVEASAARRRLPPHPRLRRRRDRVSASRADHCECAKTRQSLGAHVGGFILSTTRIDERMRGLRRSHRSSMNCFTRL